MRTYYVYSDGVIALRPPKVSLETKGEIEIPRKVRAKNKTEARFKAFGYPPRCENGFQHLDSQGVCTCERKGK